jgi:serine/threonine protein kinase
VYGTTKMVRLSWARPGTTHDSLGLRGWCGRVCEQGRRSKDRHADNCVLLPRCRAKQTEDSLSASVPPFTPGLGRRIAVDVARGLHYLHNRRIVHLDLKSPNVSAARPGTQCRI